MSGDDGITDLNITDEELTELALAADPAAPPPGRRRTYERPPVPISRRSAPALVHASGRQVGWWPTVEASVGARSGLSVFPD